MLGVQTAAQTASTKSSWTSPIQKVLQQQRINSSLSSGGNRDSNKIESFKKNWGVETVILVESFENPAA